ncbi:Na+/H+ antiporter subunit E [Isoptericola variabilis]|uniref:Multisubunit Na+/H+ antiporter MnhE subunit-like protein n=1 Tax=Isoptericola variabilis (strain 225) TaxID=743718 RepID=F6FSV2_ISOV2|nr:Na+/H+ antiporter subunit E [Isoptericola variabilis]AEG43093.1 multisubunit Na+/H+ antiporter MnhE subunit-like protein [Isoptericola variabilis 225]TWH35020.1 multicomponent Na+:H+ antiporter subunit E [Isoptericola variabilis J7]
MSPQRLRRRVLRLRIHWPTLLVLAGVWIVLWGDLSWANVVGGLAVSALAVVLFPLPAVAADTTLRPWPFLRLLGHFAVDVFAASFQVAWLAFRPGPAPRAGIVGVRLRNPDDVVLTVTAAITSLVPGSVVVEAQRRSGMLFLHVLDLEGSGGPDGVRERTLALEERVLRAFAGRRLLERVELGAGREG